MSVSNLPTLIIGIGGIGCKIAAGISKSLSDQDRRVVSVIGMDTNVSDLSELDAPDMKIIRTSDARQVSRYLEQRPAFREWVPDDRFLKLRTMENGAGQIRLLSRMAAVAAKERGDFAVIESEIQRIMVRVGDQLTGSLAVMIVGSHTGGTGAGLFLQLPYYIRHYLRQHMATPKIVIRGLFVGPDITAPLQKLPLNATAVRVNGYTCLKEANTLYLRQNDGNSELGDRIRLEYFDQERDQIPYNYLYLLERMGIGGASMPDVIRQASSMVFTLLFTPVTGRTLSDDDNFLLGQIGTGGMNRYSSMGLCKLVYPQKEVVQYVTRRSVQEMVQKEWLLLDKSVENSIQQAKLNQRHDPTVQIPDKGTMYLVGFRENVNDGKSLSSLRSEAYDLDTYGNLVSKAEGMVVQISARVRRVAELSEFRGAKELCTLDYTEATSMATAESAFETATRYALKLVGTTKKLTENYRFQIADAIFPVALDMLEQRVDSDDSIYQWFAKVHPVTARFLCYDLLERLDHKMKELDQKLKGYNLRSFEEYDFSPEEGLQNPTMAFDLIRAGNTGGWGASIKDALTKKSQKELKILASDVQDQLSLLTSNCENYLKSKLERETCETLKKRISLLSKQYELFFGTIETKINEMAEEITESELVYEKERLGEIGVYCSQEALQHIYNTYSRNKLQTLNEDTRTAVFTEIFRITSDAINEETTFASEEQKRKAVQQRKERLGRVFNKAIVNTVQTEVESETGAGKVRMNIREALRKEQELKENLSGLGLSDAEIRQRNDEYAKNRILQAFGKAEPMIGAERNNPDMAAALVYLAIHPDCADHRDDQPDEGATTAALVPAPEPRTDNSSTTLLIDREFQNTEIVCLRQWHLFLIEELLQYGTNSENAIAYRERIHTLRYGNSNDVTDEELAKAITPHLDARWHEMAYFPALLPKERTEEKKNLRMAFIYGLAYGMFAKLLDADRDSDEMVWHFYGERITNFGRNIGGSYNDLYNSLPCNGRIVEQILERAKKNNDKIRGYKSADDLAEEMHDHLPVRNLLGGSYACGGTRENLLDILLRMREGMPEEEWKKLFDGVRDVLWDYCVTMFEDSRVRLIDNKTRTIVRMLCLSSNLPFAVDDDKALIVDSENRPSFTEGAPRGADRMIPQISGLLTRSYEEMKETH